MLLKLQVALIKCVAFLLPLADEVNVLKKLTMKIDNIKKNVQNKKN